MKLQIVLLFLCINHLLSQSWISGPSLPDSAEGRHHPVTFSIGDFGYVGLGSSPNAYTDNFYQYNSITDTWKEIKKFPGGGRGFSIGDSYNGKGYLGFGLSEKGEYLADLWEYDPNNDSWSRKTPCPCTARAHPAFIAMDGKIYVGLGGSSGGDLNDFWEYDIATDKWSKMPNLPANPRHHPFQFGISPYLYAGMGHGGPIIYKDLYRYDPSIKKWKEMSPLPVQGRVAGTQFSYNGRGYVLSGQGETHDYMERGEFWEYEPATDSWKELPEHPGSSRWAPGSFVIGKKAYFTCGQDPIKYYNDLMVFDFNILNSNDLNKSDLSIVSYNSDNIVLSSNSILKTIEIINSSGNSIEKVKNRNEDLYKINIEINHLPAGIYILKSDSFGSKRFVKF